MAVAEDLYYYNNYYRKSGQQLIPAFGDWENVNELPITQYFECARQAGLLRCCCSSCATNVDAAYHKPPLLNPNINAAPPPPQTKKKTRGINSKEQRKVVMMDDHQPRNHSPNRHNKSAANLNSSINVKPVDEDLYKIPSELLQNSKRKRMLGFFSRCMVPPCAA